MFLARIVFFRLYESPRYLVHAGRPQEAVKALQMISRFNGSDLSIELDDVVDHRHPSQETACGQVVSTTAVGNATKTVDDVHRSSAIPIIQNTTEVDETSPLGTPPDEDVVPFGSSLVADYHATGETVVPDSLPSEGQTEDLKKGSNDVEEEESEDAPLNPGAISPSRRGRRSRSTFSTSSRALAEQKGRKARLRGVFPRWLADPLDAWTDRVVMVLSPEWLRTTLLVWSAWFGMSLGAPLMLTCFRPRSELTYTSAFTMFNVFLPKLLESTPSRSAIIKPKSLEESLWDVVVFTIGGCPGAIVHQLLHMYRHITDSRLAWRTPHRVFVRPQVVLGREHSCYRPDVHHLYDGAIALGCPSDNSWH